MDSLVSSYLEAPDSAAADQSLAELAAAAEPIVRRVIQAKLAGRWDDVGDICSEATLELLLHLRRLRAGTSDGNSVTDFPAYVATIARNSCHRYFRRRHPGRTLLKRQIAFLLDEEAAFAVRDRLGRRECGLAAWGVQHPSAQVPEPAAITGDRDLVTLVTRVLETAAGWVELNAVVGLVARLWGIDAAEEGPPSEELPARGVDPVAKLDQRRFVEQLWREIQQLPRPQRVALLLNLVDGRGSSVLALFSWMGVASFSQTAAVLELTPQALARIWNELPWDDLTIGRFLGLARQQVINLRQAARKRLSNRLGARPW